MPSIASMKYYKLKGKVLSYNSDFLVNNES